MQTVAAEKFCSRYGCYPIESGPADPIDYKMLKDGKAVGFFEVKNRNMSYDPSYGGFRLPNGYRTRRYLISKHKIDAMLLQAKATELPCGLLVQTMEDEPMTLLFWSIVDANGNFKFKMEYERTETQATCNGGTANRVNAFLPISKAIIHEYP